MVFFQINIVNKSIIVKNISLLKTIKHDKKNLRILIEILTLLSKPWQMAKKNPRMFTLCFALQNPGPNSNLVSFNK